MKLEINNGKVTAVPETDSELKVLIELAGRKTMGSNLTIVNKHHTRKDRQCPACPKICAGGSGLAKHVRATHPELYTREMFPMMREKAEQKQPTLS